MCQQIWIRRFLRVFTTMNYSRTELFCFICTFKLYSQDQAITLDEHFTDKWRRHAYLDFIPGQVLLNWDVYSDSTDTASE